MSAINSHQQGSNLKRLVGAIRSRHPAVYLGLAVKALSPFTRRLDDLILRWAASDLTHQPNLPRCLFIVCPPRSGGTVIYQALTRAIPSIYLSNAHALFPALATRWLRSNRSQRRESQTFNNYYGYSSHLFDVYEGNEFFEWLHDPSDAIHLSNQTLRLKFSRLIEQLSPLPTECVILKNARAYAAVAKLHGAVPEILFIRVKRERSQVVESVVRAFYELKSFHPVPPSLQETNITDPIEYAVAQIEAIEATLDEQFATLSPEARIEISYEAFCLDPYAFINTLTYDFLKFPPGSVQDSSALAQLKPSRRRKVSESDRVKIQSLIHQKKQKRRDLL